MGKFQNIVLTRNLIFGFFLTLSFISHSNADVSCGVNTCEGPAKELISQFYPIINGGRKVVVITPSPVIFNGLSCPQDLGGSNIGLKGPVSSATGEIEPNVFDENYSILLLSYANNENLVIRVVGNGSCDVRDLRLKS